MLNSGVVLKISLVAVVLVAAVESGPMQKLGDCCKSVNKEKIQEPIRRYWVQKADPPCVNAVIFETASGYFCSSIKPLWVRNKIRELEKLKARSTTP